VEFAGSGGTYGSPRITDELRDKGWTVSKNTVAELMRELGLVARPTKRRKSTTRQDAGHWRAPDLLGRNFSAPAPNVRWCGDGTEIPTDEGKLYLDAVEDLFSRRLLGFAMGTHHDEALAEAALQMAVAIRGGSVQGVVFHTDQGSEYTAGAFRNACTRLGITQSMGRAGSALDNAAAESFFSTLEHELLSRRRFTTRQEARREVAAFIDGFYNPRRRHSANTIAGRMVSPIDFEVATAQAVVQAASGGDKEAA
jgi:transposase InsO family protein